MRLFPKTHADYTSLSFSVCSALWLGCVFIPSLVFGEPVLGLNWIRFVYGQEVAATIHLICLLSLAYLLVGGLAFSFFGRWRLGGTHILVGFVGIIGLLITAVFEKLDF